mmetsp:Transcript_91891/g.256827  ORF Transcript_91891/g.256827 Transcript_91891/m.256827 type:complete len:277 (-) Transcript_91891:105-935(-)
MHDAERLHHCETLQHVDHQRKSLLQRHDGSPGRRPLTLPIRDQRGQGASAGGLREHEGLILVRPHVKDLGHDARVAQHLGDAQVPLRRGVSRLPHAELYIHIGRGARDTHHHRVGHFLAGDELGAAGLELPRPIRRQHDVPPRVPAVVIVAQDPRRDLLQAQLPVLRKPQGPREAPLRRRHGSKPGGVPTVVAKPRRPQAAGPLRFLRRRQRRGRRGREKRRDERPLREAFRDLEQRGRGLRSGLHAVAHRHPREREGGEGRHRDERRHRHDLPRA